MLTHVPFADDYVLVAANSQDLQNDSQQLANVYEEIGMEMNLSKTK